MAKCKECYHYLVCKYWNNEDKECSQFKSNSNCAEVVRCKDCKSYDDAGFCWRWDYEPGMSPNTVDPDDFCSYGERREGE